MCESDFIIGCGDDSLDSLISSCTNCILLGNHVVCHLICAFSRHISLSKVFFLLLLIILWLVDPQVVHSLRVNLKNVFQI